MSDELSRYEINTRVKQILVSYNVDMTKISYSCVNRTIHMYGSLNAYDQGEFKLTTIQNLVEELMKLPHIRGIQFDLDNWVISAEPGELNITKAGVQIAGTPLGIKRQPK